MAYYPVEEAEGISAGQLVRISLGQGATAAAAPRVGAGTVWKGKVEEVYPPQLMSLPGANGAAGEGGGTLLLWRSASPSMTARRWRRPLPQVLV